MRAFGTVMLREWRLRARGGGWAASLGLFLGVCGLAPLAFGREAELLSAAGPGLVWIAAGLALLIGLDGLYEEERASGGLDVLRLSAVPLPLVVLAKAIAAWATAGLPLVLAAPLALVAYGRSAEEALFGTLGLLLGTPALALLATAIGALAAGVRRGTGLVVFLCLPLFVPAFVLGPSSAGTAPGGALLLLAAFSLQALAVCPFVGAAGLRAVAD